MLSEGGEPQVGDTAITAVLELRGEVVGTPYLTLPYFTLPYLTSPVAGRWAWPRIAPLTGGAVSR